MEKEMVGFIGLGNIGMPMVRSLLRDGWPVTVFDLREEAVEEAVSLGAATARTLNGLGEACSTILVAVVDDNQVKSVVVGEGGLLETIQPGATIVIHSTIQPTTILEVAETAKASGVTVIDAAVSGAADSAEVGNLTVLVGGGDHDVEKLRPVLESVGGRVLHMGPLGSGVATKVANNVMNLGNKLLALQAVKLAEAYGIDEDRFLAAARQSSGDSSVIRNWGRVERILREHTLAGTPEIYQFFAKDLQVAVQAGDQRGIPLPLVSAAADLLPSIFKQREDEIADKTPQ